MTANATPESILQFWFPDGANPDLERHKAFWLWRMRGGADAEILSCYSDLTELAAKGGIDDWARTAHGRLALIIVLDQFPRTVWAGSAKAYSQDSKALRVCLEGLENGDFDRLETVWYKTVYKLPLEHCECEDHLTNLDRAVEIADQLLMDAPDNLKAFYEFAAGQPRKHREVIRQFGRHAHRNEILGRTSTPQELAYIAKGVFPHVTQMDLNN